MDKLREEFEEWFNKEMVLHISTSNETVVRLMWKAWQASRASIVVELPEMEDFELLDGYKVRESLRSIGLSIKGDRV
ncbi:hypothetical protein CLM65_10935 [Serratia marcescens]|uniref:hypothetical protein n=1 Tax=Serratia TaxID=613 RepID=UPI000535841D|nr:MULTISPECIES: hypothetical protein [Serratia]ASM17997.1 hypothetical protein BVG90_15230 [Serratia marcescens]AWC73642.1 hypothetical protein AM371_01210 [Serratia marcescens]EIJ6701967.1 hypothetical protein [Serratia marcescens]EIV5186805.1 hypothetical protein [Serratia marcescens]EIY2711357.1 hypothetical protein [Serratia marcescens]